MTTKKNLVKQMFMSILTAAIFSFSFVFTACSDDEFVNNPEEGSNMIGNYANNIRLPNSNIVLTYPMTVNAEFEEACKDRNPGFKPDVMIPLPYPEQLTDNIDSWVLWVAKKMKK